MNATEKAAVDDFVSELRAILTEFVPSLSLSLAEEIGVDVKLSAEDWQMYTGPKGGTYWVHKGHDPQDPKSHVYLKQNPGATRKPDALTNEQHIANLRGQISSEIADKSHPVNIHRDKVANARFGNSSVQTLRSTAENPLTAEEHGRMEKLHRLSAALHKRIGNTELSQSHASAANYHGGVASTKRAISSLATSFSPLSKAGEVAASTFDKQIASSSGLSDGHKKKYGEAMRTVLSAMPDKAIGRVLANLKGSNFYGSVEELADNLHRMGHIDNEMMSRIQKTKGYPGGMYSPRKMEVFLDGDQQHSPGEAFGGSTRDTHGTYAHELSHALDGVNKEHSRSEEWLEAYRDEIEKPSASGGHRLSKYAKKKPSEGWAEFGRLVYGTNTDRARIERMFPKASAYWKKHGFWE